MAFDRYSQATFKAQYLLMSRLFSRTLIFVVFISLVAGCATVPTDFPKQYSEAISDTRDTRLGQRVTQWTENHAGKSGFYPLIEGMDALGVRLALIDRAEKTIDAQYFMMKPDSTGYLFAMKLLEAADRGVRVRFLLDDIFTTVSDDGLLVLNQHPNIEIRLFNPISRVGSFYLNYLGDFKVANRRMHNKTFTVDNQVSVVGGRNIADEYFGLDKNTKFRDADMIAFGSVAKDISKTFDRFWNHKLAIPMEAFENNKTLPDIATARANLDKSIVEANHSIYKQALSSALMQDLIDNRVEFYPSDSQVITDDPEKLLNEVSSDHKILVTALANSVNKAESEVVVVTPYFIPRKTGVEFWRNIVDNGSRVVVITNSLASNNHIPVHAAYSRYRHDIINAGVELYEIRVDSSKKPTGEIGYDSVTLHTKAILIDRQRLFIGSLNQDPRSIDLNTEMGLMIDNTNLANDLADQVFSVLPTFTYRVTENDQGFLRWTATIDGKEVIETSEPHASSWLKLKAFISRIFPEDQL
jgi:cardiolipin synthase C